ncbi:YrrS family protein [Planococcus salinus]|uniref:DUF1510 family protein n=1 Tax=Planococcus salinus TaxID=1848460 RepID=A0A3M8PB85_9BACL|nr:YrrS family protein [Planococcus salinus]RNF40986.1 DUF1510 family protein [Planococcus salinus]
MSNDQKPYPSRLNKRNRNRSNSILNMMIGLVFTLILITGAFIFLDGDEEEAHEPESVQIASGSEGQTNMKDNGADEGAASQNDAEPQESEPQDDSSEEQTGSDESGEATVGGTITREESNDPIVEETVINTSWEPIGTSQSGEHVSVYQKDSVDWQEKVSALSYATGLAEDDMYVMMIQNGGGPQKSIGTVTSKDQSKKYRVHLEWVDGEGWKPMKMDVLKTLEGAY